MSARMGASGQSEHSLAKDENWRSRSDHGYAANRAKARNEPDALDG